MDLTNGTLSSGRIGYRTAKVHGLEIVYREGAPGDAPAVLLLHGFPTSSHMFRNPIRTRSNRTGPRSPR